jgi:hypothetical protein
LRSLRSKGGAFRFLPLVIEYFVWYICTSYKIQRSLIDTWLPPQMLGGVKSVRYFRNLMFKALSAFAEGTVFRNIALNLNVQKKEIS